MGGDKGEGVEIKEEDHSSPSACEQFKKKHDKCFFAWYHDEFIQGKATELPCQAEWDLYEECLKKKLKAFDLLYLKEEVEGEKN
mmetsp:Transcript_6500/g.26810  ORF Transcript_6500/g.26810 Transcript_6500/m.26810 type:complete len:84 (+) Transcript_6500:46-297(+)